MNGSNWSSRGARLVGAIWTARRTSFHLPFRPGKIAGAMAGILYWSFTLLVLLVVTQIVYQVVTSLKAKNAPPVTVAQPSVVPKVAGPSKTAKKNAKRKAKERTANESATVPNDTASLSQEAFLPVQVPQQDPQVLPELTKTQVQKLKETNRKLLDSYHGHLRTLQEIRKEKNRRTLSGNRFATTRDVLDEDDLEGYLSDDEIDTIPIHKLGELLKTKIKEIQDAIEAESDGSAPTAPKVRKVSSSTPTISPRKKAAKEKRGSANGDEEGWQVVPQTKKAAKGKPDAPFFASSRVDPEQFEYAPTTSTLASREAARVPKNLPVGLTSDDAYMWSEESKPQDKSGSGKKSNNRRKPKKSQQYIPGLN